MLLTLLSCPDHADLISNIVSNCLYQDSALVITLFSFTEQDQLDRPIRSTHLTPTARRLLHMLSAVNIIQQQVIIVFYD